MKRRDFVGLVPSTALLFSGKEIELNADSPVLPISCNVYNWMTFYEQSGKAWGENWDDCIGEFPLTKIPAIEPSISDVRELNELIPYLEKYQIKVPSIYVGSVMHEEVEAKKSTAAILEIAEKAKTLGTKIIVTNPNPIQWGSALLKNDKQLLCQSAHLDKLGKSLRSLGLRLAYHTHDVELRAGAREFHHTLQNTSPENLFFCMDVHWIYRGSENSQNAVFDVLKMYGKRIIEFHLRQSENGIWTESFHAAGDIDYVRLAQEVKKMGINPHLVIEQCLEEKTPRHQNVVEAHKIDLMEVKKLFNR
jgi:inosose dehydratase